MKLNIYVPTESYPGPGIAPGSGIVGLPTEDPGSIVLYYEGNLNGASNLNTWLDRLQCAAGRMATRYPTIAKSWVGDDRVLKIGSIEYDPSVGIQSLSIDNVDALRSYLGEEADKVVDQFKEKLAEREMLRRFRMRR